MTLICLIFDPYTTLLQAVYDTLWLLYHMFDTTWPFYELYMTMPGSCINFNEEACTNTKSTRGNLENLWEIPSVIFSWDSPQYQILMFKSFEVGPILLAKGQPGVAMRP